MNPLLVALDVDTSAEARRLTNELRGGVVGFKVGSQLFASQGPSIIDELVARGDRVFLDLKFHDIPNTVAAAVRAATRQGVWMLNVHASGGSEMMRAARAAANEEAARSSQPPPILIAVTLLTSLSEAMLPEIGMMSPLAEQVRRLALLARAAGLDGVVASPLETPIIRRACGADFVVVTPGIRSGSPRGEASRDDQQRTMTAAAAVAAGANYLVVGRPVIAAPDPRAAAEQLLAECCPA